MIVPVASLMGGGAVLKDAHHMPKKTDFTGSAHASRKLHSHPSAPV